MDDREYRRLCSQPDVTARGDLRATAVRLTDRRPDLAAEVQRLLAGSPVPRPSEHEGSRETDYLWLDISDETIEEIVDELGTLEADLVETGAPHRTVSVAAELLDRWNAAESSRTSGLT